MHAIAVAHDALHDVLLPFRLIEGLLDIVDIVGDLHIDIRQHTADIFIIDEHAVMDVLDIELRHFTHSGDIEDEPCHNHQYGHPYQQPARNLCFDSLKTPYHLYQL